MQNKILRVALIGVGNMGKKYAQKNQEKAKKKPADLVASDDGKVISIVTSAGTAKVRKGKKVKKGKVLISGGITGQRRRD